jgi:hypothetical protein
LEAQMNLWEVDWRIAPLESVIVGIGHGLAEIRERLDTEEFDGDDACEHAEPLIGLGFVAAQTYALGTVSDLNRVRMSRGKSKKEKIDCYACDTILLDGRVTRIQLINAAANYFKHQDEWETRWPTERHGAKTLGCFGITEETEFPCKRAVEQLCGTSLELIVLHQIVKEWREYLFRTLL